MARRHPLAAAAAYRLPEHRLREWLKRQPDQTYCSMMDRLIVSDVRVRRLVSMQIATDSLATSPADVALLRDLIREAMVPESYVREEDESDYSDGVRDVIAVLERSQAAGSPAQIREMCAFAIGCATDALEQLAEGWYMNDLTTQLITLHQQACRSAPPDRAALARWVLDMRRTDLGQCMKTTFDSYDAFS